jgi:hypothetical protein
VGFASNEILHVLSRLLDESVDRRKLGRFGGVGRGELGFFSGHGRSLFGTDIGLLFFARRLEANGIAALSLGSENTVSLGYRFGKMEAAELRSSFSAHIFDWATQGQRR